MTELYTNMRYLQYGTLQKLGLGHFDSWAASFGETQTAIEIAPVLKVHNQNLPEDGNTLKIIHGG